MLLKTMWWNFRCVCVWCSNMFWCNFYGHLLVLFCVFSLWNIFMNCLLFFIKCLRFCSVKRVWTKNNIFVKGNISKKKSHKTEKMWHFSFNYWILKFVDLKKRKIIILKFKTNMSKVCIFHLCKISDVCACLIGIYLISRIFSFGVFFFLIACI